MSTSQRLLWGLWVLLRPLPVIAWSGGACLLAVGLAVRSGAIISPARVLRLIAAAALIQGWLAHSLNDRTDWQSGTDLTADETWSGGSGVLRLGYLCEQQLMPIAVISVLLVFGITIGQVGNNVIYIYLLVGLWGAISYSQAPWRLAYTPLLGEWLAAFPAIVACSLAVYQVLQGGMGFFPAAAAVLQGLLAIAWLMQHHLPDWQRDLQASPPKQTTVAFIAARFGSQAARLVVVAYFALAALLALALSLADQRFIWSAAVAGSGALLAHWQSMDLKQKMAWRELQMVGLMLLHAWVLGWVV